MNKSIIAIAITAVLTVTFLGVLRDHQSTILTPINRWIHQPDLAEREKASALRPLITCLNSVDSRWRQAYANYLNRGHEVDLTLKKRFPEDVGPMTDVNERLNYLRSHDAYSCRLNALQKNSLQKSAPDLLPLQNRFETSLGAANDAAGRFDFFNPTPLYSVSTADKVERDSLFLPLVDDYLNASDDLRRALDAEDRSLRQVQLEQLKTRDQLKYAHLLTYMLEARTLMFKLDSRVRERTFAASDLSDATLALQQAWDNGSRYMEANPATSNADYPENIWNYVRSPGKNYLDSVNRLRDDWAAKASPQQLSDDFDRIGRRYDQLVEVYNERVNPLF
ncbi:DUF3829 domain-containing protein [Pseudomonas sp. H3(2019)]|uniref:DUF3829 domain-containing protein n=1 Tax=Pseudomonas sp. H3(2019) TaxID=2598724 RepID=UPI001192357C|nr:DUF3829 domain-containing protein [Pseudomonas sp. H3(2019)]TVT83059.1 DUF3829 domain-containing protein [Pseudomonas sp. H3(2019)]